MKHTVIALFDTPDDAQKAAQALKARGLEAAASQASEGADAAADAEELPPAATIEGGPLSGLLHRLASLFGVEEPHLAHYQEAVRRGGTVVQVDAADEAQATTARDTLLAMGAVNIDDRVESWRQAGWRSPAGAATVAAGVMHRQETSIGGVRVYGHVEGPAFDELADDFRADHASRYAEQGSYGDFEPAYRYGHALAQDSRYEGLRWDEMEADARAEWEQRYPQSAWERFKAAVRHAWERASRP